MSDLRVMGSADIIFPASITFVSVPTFGFSGGGVLYVSGSSQSFVRIEKSFESSWNIDGVFSSGFVSEWAVGEGEYYWYRVESSCGEMKCDSNGIYYPDCRNMTFMTVVPARNIVELCQKLSNPSINPPVNLRISSVKKYARPLERSSTSPECNSLEEQDFCQIAECLDYCIDQDILQRVSFSMRAIESVRVLEMSGGPSVYGQVQTNKFRVFLPEYSVVRVSGSSFALATFAGKVSGSLVLSGSASTVSSAHSFESSGSIGLGGYARTMSPNRKYSDPEGSLEVFGSSRLGYAPRLVSSIGVSGSATPRFKMNFAFSGKLEFEGRIRDYTSPKYRHKGSGSVLVSGSTSLNFSDFGTFSENFSFPMSAFDFSSESEPPKYDSRLTISDGSISPSCGCGPMGLFLSLKSNMSNSAFLSAFLKRAGLNLPDPVLRYRNRDVSWSSVQHLVGRGRDGTSIEDLYLSHSLSCSEGFWVFSFSASTFNRVTLGELRTKFILDIPVDLVCFDGNISSVIELNIRSGEFRLSTGREVSVVDPPRPLKKNPNPRRIDVFVDGVFNDKRIYYDELGMFKDSYWNSKNLKIEIDSIAKTKMPKMQFSEIFQS